MGTKGEMMQTWTGGASLERSPCGWLSLHCGLLCSVHQLTNVHSADPEWETRGMLGNVSVTKSEDHLLPLEKIVFVMVGNKCQQLKHCPQVGFFMQLLGKLDFHKQLRWSHLLCRGCL